MPGGVVLGQREGRATGDCYVTFSNPAEAQRAMVMNNKHMVRSPTIRDARDPAASQCSA
mgnify:CR=1 FL=1